MAYNENEDSTIGDIQDTDGVNRANMYITENNGSNELGERELVAELNEFLMTPRFDGDSCVILTMPVQVLKKAREKINQAVLHVYERHKSPEFKIFDVLVALESMVDASVISAILDIDIKRTIAADRGIVISDQQLDDIASGKVPPKAAPQNDIVTCPKCGGTGEIDGVECDLCLGVGKVRKIVGPAPSSTFDDSDDELDMGDMDMSELDGLDDVILED